MALTAPPGSGKTLLVPAFLKEQTECSTVYVLEPRRVTARLPALALQEVLGQMVGYQIRFEKAWHSRETTVGYLTYGTALRIFCGNPPKSDDIVIFDEFHERQWEAELLLAFLRSLTEGPRLLLMSATLDRESLPPEVPVIESDGRLHPVSVSHEMVEPQLLGSRERLAKLVAERSAEWGTRVRGEQLIFLPGLGDIRAVQEKLLADHIEGPVDVLHSTLSEKEIRRVVDRPAKAGFRRILSTDLAESSVTLPGIQVVLDSGLVRRPNRDRLDLGVTLRTVGAPIASLTQRAGRAGRLGPGFCHRLFTKQQELHRPLFPRPQMEEAEYRTVCLFLASLDLLEGWADLQWLYAPIQERLEKSRGWAEQAGLLQAGTLTELGRQILDFPLEPRLAAFAVKARAGGNPVDQIVKWCQALERPPAGQESWALEDWAPKVEVDQRLKQQVLGKLQAVRPDTSCQLSEALLDTFGDTVAQLSDDRAVCANPDQPAMAVKTRYPSKGVLAVLLAAAPRGGGGPDSFCTLYQPVEAEKIWEHKFEDISEQVESFFENSLKAVRVRREIKLGSLVLERQTEAANPGRETAQILRDNLRLDDFGSEFQSLRRRLSLLRRHRSDDEVPDIEELLLSYLDTVASWNKNSEQQLLNHIRGLIPYSLMQTLDQELPTSVQLPGRRKPVTVHYPPDGDPYVASKLQDFMGWKQPRLLGGELDLVCHLLAPNGRACQITTDLDSFWAGSYQQVRKDLRGRYPKHHWPEDPSRDSGV